MARGGGKGGRREMPREQQVSRKVSWLLRHGAGSEGLKLGQGGYVGVADALNTNALKSIKVTFPELKQVVADNDKQRFSMIHVSALAKAASTSATASQEEPPKEEEISQEALASIPESSDPADYLIRANQGHSIKVDTEGLLTPLTLSSPDFPEIVVHGTDERAWELIVKSGGMRRMGRTHMHFAKGLPAGFKTLDPTSAEASDAPVISGMRNTSTILIYIDLRKALDAGIEWFTSDNGVVLTAGDERGCLGSEFFLRVESRKKSNGGVLMKDGELPEGAVVDVEAWEKEVGGKGRRGGGRGGRGGRGGGGRGGKSKVNDDSTDLMAGV